MHVRLGPSEYFGEKRLHHDGAGFVVTETRCETGLDVPAHEHQRAYLCFVLAGGYRESHKSNLYDCETLRAIYRPAGYLHSNVISPEGAVCLNVEFESAFFETPRDPLKRCMPEFSKSAFQIFRELRIADQDSRLSMESSIGNLCSLLNGVQPIGSRKAPVWILEAKQILREEIHIPWNLKSLADGASVHPVHFCRQFHSHVGMSIGEYVRHTRIEIAIGLLRRNASTLGEIACETGFSDQAHFTRTFRRLCGLTPSQFRDAVLN